MSFDSTNLTHLTRQKLLSVSDPVKDSMSLHRWVLLKHSILKSPSQNTSNFSNTQPEVSASSYLHGDREDDQGTESDISSFLFPDAGHLVERSVSVPSSGAMSSEAQWMDSLLETLGDGADDDDDHFNVNFDHSVHMFEQAHDVVISGGQFYNTAGSMAIDNSLNIDASIHPGNITHLYHSSNQVVLHSMIYTEQLPRLTGERDNGNPFRNTRSKLDEDGTSEETKEEERAQNNVPSFSSLKAEWLYLVVDRLSESDGSILENQHEQPIQNSSPATFSADDSITDEVVRGILCNYPPPPIGDPRSFNCIVNALLFSFSPLSASAIAALFNLNNAQNVRRILLPAYPLVFVPMSRDNQEGHDDDTPVRFIHPSIVEFFLDRTRSGKHFVDAQMAHRVLLEGSAAVMRKVHEEGKRLDSMGRGWRDAYEYACQHWEAHRRAGTRSKL